MPSSRTRAPDCIRACRRRRRGDAVSAFGEHVAAGGLRWRARDGGYMNHWKHEQRDNREPVPVGANAPRVGTVSAIHGGTGSPGNGSRLGFASARLSANHRTGETRRKSSGMIFCWNDRAK